MKTCALSNGDRMPAIGLGTWKAAPGEVHDAIVEALRIGYRHIDCAWIYGNEAEIGAALAKCFRDRVVARQDVWITSKLWCDAHAPEDVEPALRESLSALNLEYLDLYLMHWPIALKRGVAIPRSATDMISLDSMPVATTWSAMERLVERGLCRHVGVSNFSRDRLANLVAAAGVRPAVNQVEMHPYLPQDALREYCAAHAIVVTAYSPFGSRDRLPSQKRPDEPDLFSDPIIGSIAIQRRVSPAQVILGWLLAQGVVTTPKSVSAVRLAENFAAQAIALSDVEIRRIAEIERRYRYVNGSFWELEGGPYSVASLWDEPS